MHHVNAHKVVSKKKHLSYTAPIRDHDLCILSTPCDLFINCDLVMDGF